MCHATPRHGSDCTARRAILQRRTMRLFSPFFAFALIGCMTAPASEPSLARRPAEAVDPRVPISSQPDPGTVEAALAEQLMTLVALGREGARAFEAEAPAAEALAAAAGPAQSESWIAAQQALSGLEGARAPTTRARGDVDSLAAERIVAKGGLVPAEMAAIDAAAAELGAVADRQARVIDAIAARLAL